MKTTAFVLGVGLCLLSSCEQAKYAVSSGIDGVKNQWCQNSDEGFLNLVAYAARSEEFERADKWLAQVYHPENKASGLITLAQYELLHNGIAREETQKQLEEIIPCVEDPKLKMLARLELADVEFSKNKDKGLSRIEEIECDIWDVSSAHLRAPMLIRLLTFRIEREKNITKAREIIDQTERTIRVMFDSRDKYDIQNQLKGILEAHSNLFCK
ncbi:MAG: hypothetical protein K1000chlam3_00365 [Chlamydiae bacterium]|nr:hypothetical protein [Chlamydiota bacterium]